MTRQLKGKQIQVTDFDAHKAYIKAALDTKRDCDDLVDLLVNDLRKERPSQTVVLLEAAIRSGRDVEVLCRWARTALLLGPKIPREKIDELGTIQVALAAFRAKIRGVTWRQ